MYLSVFLFDLKMDKTYDHWDFLFCNMWVNIDI